jgi:hypothetical protein
VVRVDGEGFVLGIVLRLGIDFRKGHGATGADTTGSDVAGFITEDEALEDISISSGEVEMSELTATMLKKPITMQRIPEATSRRQKGIPSDS